MHQDEKAGAETLYNSCSSLNVFRFCDVLVAVVAGQADSFELT